MTAMQICALLSIILGVTLLYWVGYRGGLFDGRAEGHRLLAADGPTRDQTSEESGKEIEQHTTETSTALLSNVGMVNAQKTKSLCCKAAGITAPFSTTAEALIPHEKLREAAHPDATLNAQSRPLAQPVVGYTHSWDVTEYLPESKAGQRYRSVDLADIRPEEGVTLSPSHTSEIAGMTEIWPLQEAAA